MHEDIQEIVFSPQEIQAKVAELAEKITRDYKGKNLMLVVILKGAAIFLSDLSRKIKVPHIIDFIVASRVKTHPDSGEVMFIKDLDEPVHDKDVLIVEDIIDNGCTLHYIIEHLKERQPRSLKVCSLFDKPFNRQVKINPDYCGFTVPNKFVVGYGLDYRQRYRNLPYLVTLKQEIYED